MDKLWVKDVKEGERVKSVFLVARKSVPTAKSGKSYLAATFQDRTGELEARAFDKVEELGASFEEKDHVEVEGQVGTFQGRPQLRIESVTKVDPATLDAAEFLWVPAPEPKKPEKTGFSDADEQLWKELHQLVDAIADQHVKTLIRAFLEDEDVTARLRRAPAAKNVHHAYPGGLLEHTVSCLKLAHRLSDHYPQVDRDLLVAGAFFHDLGKIRELSFERNVEYSDEGRLIGHHVMTAQWIHDKARRTGVPRDLEQHIVHLVLAHHGKLEYGSPKQPMTLEALLTHEIDEIDSRVNSWLNLMGAEGGTRRWTDSQNVYGQHIWRGTLPTVQAEKRGPATEVMAPVIYVPRNPAASGPQQQRDGQKRKPKPPRPPQERREQQPRAAAEGQAAAAGAAAPAAEGQAPRPERPERPPRPERTDRPHHAGGPPGHGPGGDRGPRGPGGPGDRKPRYMGPRLPGDKGPQPRPKEKALTHNPFAALAAKLEGGAEGAERHTEAAPESAPETQVETPVERSAETTPVTAAPPQQAETPEQRAPESAPEPAAASPAPEAPEGGGESGEPKPQ
jgi:3'-5' exoribonuclease